MDKILKILWNCKKNILIVWLFLFALSFAGKTPHNIFVLFFISGLFSITINFISILMIKK